MDGEAPLATQEQQADAFVNKPKLDASILGRGRGQLLRKKLEAWLLLLKLSGGLLVL